MLSNTLKRAGTAVLIGGLAFTSIGVMARQDAKVKNEEEVSDVKYAAPSPGPTSPAASARTDSSPPKVDTTGELAKLAELRRGLLKAANAEWEQAYKDYLKANAGLEGAYQASKRLMEAYQECVDMPDGRSTAVTAHSDRIRRLARAQLQNAPASDIAAAQVRAYAAEAELWLAQAKTSLSNNEKVKESGPASRNNDKRGKDVKSQLILAKLDEPIAMSFVEDTPLDDILKYIKQATTTQTYGGIPIYVDPLGLQEAEKTMASTVKGIDLEGIPLRRTLQLLLKQIGLIYFVEDGMVYITSNESEDDHGVLDRAIAQPSPIMQKTAKAERGELSLPEMQDLLQHLKTREQIMKFAGAGRDHGEDNAKSNNEKAEGDENRKQMSILLKEMRELIKVLKTEHQTKTVAEGQ